MALVIRDNELVKWTDEPGVTEIIIPEGVTAIADSAFDWKHKDIRHIQLPQTLTEIGMYAFAGMNIEEIVIPENVRAIRFQAFNGCQELETVTIQSKQVCIDGSTFSACSKLKLLTIPSTANFSSMFAPGPKMIPVRFSDLPDGENLFFGIFRKSYWTQSFNYQPDFVAPMGADKTAVYDSILAAGAYEGFNTNEDGRIRAIVWRGMETKNPISNENRAMFRDFLLTKLTKSVRLALAEEDPVRAVESLISLGVISEENEKKVKKQLEKAEQDAVRRLAADLHARITAAAQTAASEPCKAEVLDEEHQSAYKKLNAKAVLMKNGILLKPVRMADGTAAPEEILSFVIADYVSNRKISRLSDDLAAQLDADSLRSALLEIFNELKNEKQKLAFLPVLFRYADGDTVMKTYRSIVNKYNETAALGTLMLSDTREAMLFAEKKGKLTWYALARGMSEGVLRDQRLSDIGLDANGCRIYDLGNQKVTVRMQNDLSFVVEIPGKAKPAKSLPKADADPEKYAAANADFAQMKKDAKKVFKSRADRLFTEFLSGYSTKTEAWKSVFLGNPVLRVLAEKLVWTQGGKSFTLVGQSAVDEQGRAVSLEETGTIQLAHPMELTPETVRAWQDYFRSRGISQPFLQIWEPVFDPASITPDRYQGCSFFWRWAANAEKHGIHFYDEGFHAEIGFHLDGCQIEHWLNPYLRHDIDPNARFELGKFRFENYTRAVNHIVYTLDKWTIWDRIGKNDTSILEIMDRYTVAQITDFIAHAVDAGASEMSAALIAYKNERFPEYDAFAAFSLDE